MAGVLYRCVFCDTSHEVAKRADGPVYLRCPTTYMWAWYDARSFEAAGGPARRAAQRASAGARGTAGARSRTPVRSGRRSAAPSRARAGASPRTRRRAPARAPSRRARKRSRR